MEAEIQTQPDDWTRAAALNAPLPDPGQRVLALGCGTSWFMAQSYAALREPHGLTDAFPASAAPLDRQYEAAVIISRSGTTTEAIEAAQALAGRCTIIAIVADPNTPLAQHANQVIALDFADERSVVQTRFATTALTLLRASLGIDVSGSIADARTALSMPLDPTAVQAEQLTFLGQGWTTGLAHEAALKNREASQSWTESYPAMEYRHGPISIAAPGRATWMIGAAPEGIPTQVTSTGAHYLAHTDLDPLAELVLAQRVALQRARQANLDPDNPRALTRSVIL